MSVPLLRVFGSFIQRSWDLLAPSKHVHKYTRTHHVHALIRFVRYTSRVETDADTFQNFSTRVYSRGVEAFCQRVRRRKAYSQSFGPRKQDLMGKDFLRVLALSPVCHWGYVPNKPVTRAAGSGALCNSRNKPRSELANASFNAAITDEISKA